MSACTGLSMGLSFSPLPGGRPLAIVARAFTRTGAMLSGSRLAFLLARAAAPVAETVKT
ncbi:MAG: hypothetical protein ONB51_06700 [candidate division KSB1 bacterium]|nr:hypothetical protein [candidate division KSB1 bacterium]MDZ7308291.1 hypothetical protein [candidate division KSB1 bacterium]MDZ7408915.1 hypothetical protein [candidate division KSB1 bacterium]